MIKFNKIQLLIPIVLIFYSMILRLAYLGHYNFVGDELNTLNFLGSVNSSPPNLGDFLQNTLSNHRGLGQYCLNYINILIFGYINELQIRFPYLIFNLLGYLSIFLLTRKIFNSNSATFSTLIFGFNGLFIIFSKTAQYQSVILFLLPLAGYFFLRYFESRSIYNLFASSTIFSISLLFHYDSLMFLIFVLSFVFYNLIIRESLFSWARGIFTPFMVFCFTSLIILAPFYFNFFLSQSFSGDTSSYLASRLFGSKLLPRLYFGEVSTILSLYSPKFVWMIFLGLALLSIYFLNLASYSSNAGNLVKHKICTNTKKYLDRRTITLFFSILLFLSYIFGSYPVKPYISTLLAFFSTFAIIILLLKNRLQASVFALLIWFLISLLVYFYVIKDPRTHVYITFIPATVLSGFTLSKIYFYSFSSRTFSYILKVGVLSFFIFLSVYYFGMYLSVNPQYPWYEKQIFGYSYPNYSRSGSVRLHGVYGLKENNHWTEISQLFSSHCLVGTYSSNEKKSVTGFYLGYEPVTFDSDPDNIIYVKNPTVWYDTGYIDGFISSSKYSKIHSFFNGDLAVVTIYGLNSTYKKRPLCRD